MSIILENKKMYYQLWISQIGEETNNDKMDLIIENDKNKDKDVMTYFK